VERSSFARPVAAYHPIFCRILGVYWVGHHLQLSFIRSADRPLLWINIFFFSSVALVPFWTALLERVHQAPPGQVPFTAATWSAIGLTLALHWWYATRRRHVDPDVYPGLVRTAMFRVLMGRLLYLLGNRNIVL
jgi:uncharacterized membrane protein